MEINSDKIQKENKDDYNKNFQKVHVEHIKKKYSNHNFKLDVIIPSFIMLLSSLIFFFETTFNFLLPLIYDNDFFIKITNMIFDIYILFQEIGFGFHYFVSNSISEENSELLTNKKNEFFTKLSDFFDRIKNYFYSKNKDKMDKILTEISENKND